MGGETLGQRLKRLRDKKKLDDAVSEFEQRPVSEAFSVDVLSQLGVEAKDKSKDDKKSNDGLHSRNVSTGAISAGSAPKSPGGGLLPPSRSNVTTPGTPGEEEETLGQRRARLQREATQSKTQRRQSSMTLGTLNGNARLSAMNLAMDPGHNMGAPTPARTPPPGLRPSVSMADLLAANPAGQYDARKVSNEMLLASAPQTSLLARDAEEKAARKARMRLSSAEMLQPQQPSRPDLLRQASNMTGMSGGSGMYGMLPTNGGGMYVNQAQMYGMWTSQQNGQAPPSMMQLHQQGYGYPLTPGQYPNAQSPFGHVAMMPQMNGGAVSSPYGAMSVNPLSVYGANMASGGGGAAYAQSVYGMQQEGSIDQKTRNRVDAWRQSVMPS